MLPYFCTNNTTSTDEKARKNMKARTENRTSHYDREKDDGITCKTHCHLRMHTKLAKENQPSYCYPMVVRVVRNALSRQDEVVVPLTLTLEYISSDEKKKCRYTFESILFFLEKKKDNQQKRRSSRRV